MKIPTRLFLIHLKDITVWRRNEKEINKGALWCKNTTLRRYDFLRVKTLGKSQQRFVLKLICSQMIISSVNFSNDVEFWNRRTFLFNEGWVNMKFNSLRRWNPKMYMALIWTHQLWNLQGFLYYFSYLIRIEVQRTTYDNKF